MKRKKIIKPNGALCWYSAQYAKPTAQPNSSSRRALAFLRSPTRGARVLATLARWITDVPLPRGAHLSGRRRLPRGLSSASLGKHFPASLRVLGSSAWSPPGGTRRLGSPSSSVRTPSAPLFPPLNYFRGALGWKSADDFGMAPAHATVTAPIRPYKPPSRLFRPHFFFPVLASSSRARILSPIAPRRRRGLPPVEQLGP
jgi:hypothetical protein